MSVSSSSNRLNRQRTIANWCRQRLKAGFFIADTETTTVGRSAEAIQIGVIDHTGGVRLQTYLHPTSPIHPKAFAVHGLDEEALRGCPSYVDIHPQLEQLLKGQTVIAYNAEFDSAILTQTALRYSLQPIPDVLWECAMLKYASYHGEWDNYWRGFRWQTLGAACRQMRISIEGGHEALTDCFSTLELIKAMAMMDIEPEDRTA